jgi:phosphatidylserine/phosphatidylglycerophosphate/cardiolipin synthase-like enzyme
MHGLCPTTVPWSPDSIYECKPDARRLLLTSANLTYHGFHGNIEVGVLLEGKVAMDAEDLVREWSRVKLIRRVTGPSAGPR